MRDPSAVFAGAEFRERWDSPGSGNSTYGQDQRGTVTLDVWSSTPLDAECLDQLKAVQDACAALNRQMGVRRYR